MYVPYPRTIAYWREIGYGPPYVQGWQALAFATRFQVKPTRRPMAPTERFLFQKAEWNVVEKAPTSTSFGLAL